jgi:hypothetical protein
MSDTKWTPPRAIWLQVGCDDSYCDDPQCRIANDGEISWCKDQQYDSDIKYVLGSEADALRKRVAEMEAERVASQELAKKGASTNVRNNDRG